LTLAACAPLAASVPRLAPAHVIIASITNAINVLIGGPSDSSSWSTVRQYAFARSVVNHTPGKGMSPRFIVPWYIQFVDELPKTEKVRKVAL
jgi:hypothetical protein